MVTEFLAIIMGWYLLTFGLLLLLRQDRLRKVMTGVMDQPSLFFILALLTFIIGLLIVVSHNYWILAWPVVVTLLGWFILIGGLVRLFFPEETARWGHHFLKKSSHMTLTAVIVLVLGLFLLVMAYFY